MINTPSIHQKRVQGWWSSMKTKNYQGRRESYWLLLKYIDAPSIHSKPLHKRPTVPTTNCKFPLCLYHHPHSQQYHHHHHNNNRIAHRQQPDKFCGAHFLWFTRCFALLLVLASTYVGPSPEPVCRILCVSFVAVVVVTSLVGAIHAFVFTHKNAGICMDSR